jgi:hypothetical protein
VQVIQNKGGSWRIERNSRVIADGLSNARAWQMADEHDEQAQGMEETRRRIDIAMGQW